MTEPNVILDTKNVNDISGNFVVKSYQRGYRWDVQVLTLLNDLKENGDKDYCLQPIVVKREGGNTYELIDGQQRLTTLYIILQYMQKNFHLEININFSINYENRTKSEDFLNNINAQEASTNIDFFFMYNAYKSIEDWFNKSTNRLLLAIDIYRYLCTRVKVIWYEVDDSVDPIALFTRLNIGRIPLTNAELIKALFLRRNDADKEELRVDKRRQIEIAVQWDDMERQLQDERFWYFLTNDNPGDYPTKIDLLFKFMANSHFDEHEKYATFFYFDKEKEDKVKYPSVLSLWYEVRKTFLLLKEWYEDHTLYHKIGYLIASDTLTMQELIAFAKTTTDTKTQFNQLLDQKIANSITIKSDEKYMELSYENANDKVLIYKILLLFNVQSVCNSGSFQWYPFHEHKAANWTLEHIHAQQSEGLNSKEAMHDWLKQHIVSMNAVYPGEEQRELKDKMQEAIDDDKLTVEKFKSIFSEVVGLFTIDDTTSYMHFLTNMALLNGDQNSVLSNSVFDVKRSKIIEMDKHGEFIPYCTKMVFLKYYTPSKGNQIHYWSQTDRDAYRRNMNEVLRPYLQIIGKEI